MLIQYITNDWKIHWLKRVGTLMNIHLLNLLKCNYFRFNLNFFSYYFNLQKLGVPIE